MLSDKELLKDMTFKFDGPYGDDRLKELILYVAEKCQEDPTFGATKLNKILYFSDFMSFILHGEPVTGVEYMRLGQGPVPKRMKPITKQLEAEHRIAIQSRDYFGLEQQRVIPLESANLDVFKPRDIAIVDEVIKLLWGDSAKKVSLMSHGIAWKMFEDKESIPYEAAYLANSIPNQEDLDWAKELIGKYGW
jgi:hypothetical protein